MGGRTYPAGSFVIPMAQPFRPHVLDMFEPQDHPTDLQYPGGPPVAPYDNAGWSLAMQMGFRFDRIMTPVNGSLVALGELSAPAPPAAFDPRAGAWRLSPSSTDAFRAAMAMEQMQSALFHTWVAFFVGAPFLLLGLSGLAAEGGFPRWLGAFAALGGAGALIAGAAGFLGAPLPSLLFVAAATLVTLWILIAGIIALRGTGRARVAAVGRAATAPPAPRHRGTAA